MKFRYKVLFTNLILLSLGLGLVGYLMIHKNFELAKQTQLKNAIVQNNLVQSSVEYELLQLLNSASDNSVSQNADNSETSNNNTDNTGAKKKWCYRILNNSTASSDRRPREQQCALKGFIFLYIF